MGTNCVHRGKELRESRVGASGLTLLGLRVEVASWVRTERNHSLEC